MATFNNGESLASVRTKINDAIDKIDGNATISNDISVGGNITVTGTVDGRDVAADGTKLDGIEASADVTDTANVTAAGALMDSELSSEASVKALDQGVATTDSPTFAGLTTTADVSFGDNDKAIFGAGSDLEIYHSGAGSFISDVGNGALHIRGTNLILQNGDGTKRFLDGNDGGAVEIHHGDATNGIKLATTSTGVDITGTLTSDGLTVADGTSGQLNVHSTSYNIQGGTAYGDMRFNAPRFRFYEDGTTLRINIDGGDISFYEDTGTTAKFFWDASAERLGIGTTSPSQELHIYGSNEVNLQVEASTSGSGTNTSLRLKTASDGAWNIQTGNAVSGGLRFYDVSNTAERMRIDSSGNVGIGVVPKTGGSTWQHIQFGGTGNIISRFSDTTGDAMFANNYYVNSSGTDSYIADGAASRLYLNDSEFRFDQAGSGTADAAITFTRAMTLDGNGNLLVGTTDTSPHNNSSGEGVMLAPDHIEAARDSASVALFNRMGTDGDVVLIKKNGTTVGSIGTAFTTININAVNQGVLQYAGTDKIKWDNHLTPNPDNSVNLGSSSARFKDLYLSGGVYLGGTGSANLLDDYEEGTWTPTWIAASGSITANSNTSGRYTKIGRMVYVQGYISYQSNSSASGEVKVGGLPFTSVTSGFGQASNQSGGVSAFANSLWSSNSPEAGRIPANSTEILPNRDNGTGSSGLQFSDFNTNSNYSQFVFFGHYYTSS